MLSFCECWGMSLSFALSLSVVEHGIAKCRTPPGEGGVAKCKGRGIAHPKFAGTNEGALSSRDFAQQNYGETPCAALGQSPKGGLVTASSACRAQRYCLVLCGRETE